MNISLKLSTNFVTKRRNIKVRKFQKVKSSQYLSKIKSISQKLITTLPVIQVQFGDIFWNKVTV